DIDGDLGIEDGAERVKNRLAELLLIVLDEGVLIFDARLIDVGLGRIGDEPSAERREAFFIPDGRDLMDLAVFDIVAHQDPTKMESARSRASAKMSISSCVL